MKSVRQTQPTFRITNACPVDVGDGRSALSIRLVHTRGPLTEAHMDALVQAILKRHAVYLVIPESEEVTP